MRTRLTRLVAGFLLLTACGFAATVAPSPFPNVQLLDNNGQLCAGCKLYTYSAGTTTALATYSESTGVTQNANPTILDSSGRATLYFQLVAYKLVLKTSADVTLWTQDNAGFIGAGVTLPFSTPTIKFANCTDTLNVGCNGANGTITGSDGHFVVAAGGGQGGNITITAGAKGGAVALVTTAGGNGLAAGDISLAPGAGVIDSSLGAGRNGGNIILTPGNKATGGALGFVELKDSVDTSKVAKLDVSGLTTLTTRTFAFPDANVTLVGDTNTQTLSGKTISGLIGTGTTTLAGLTVSGGSSLTGGASINTVTVTGAVTSATGLQIFRVTTQNGGGAFCSTAAAVGTQCDNTIALPVTMADGNYNVVCTAKGTGTGVPIVQKSDTRNTTTFIVTTAALTASAAQFAELDCTVSHN